ncbi:MAG: hypothetical protein O2930_00405 [Acidobacteria bacterium]|nr:hypothetical protein [Acidobacteriota bacterium]
MSPHPLKAAVKRGALIAAANWQVTLIQASAGALFRLLLVTPVVGGLFLVALAVGRDPATLISLEWPEFADAITSSLMSHPRVVVACGLAMAVVLVGGSLFVVLVRAGTVATLVRSHRDAGPVEEPPLRLPAVARASRFSIDGYLTSSRSLFPRYARLCLILIGVYTMSGLSLLLLATQRGPSEGWGLTVLLAAACVVWVTGINLLYLLVQIVIAADDCSVLTAAVRVATFLRREAAPIGSVFFLVFGLVVLATGASILATAALGLMTFIPFVGLAALPLQVLAWLLRGLVFQYLGLTSVGAYLALYRTFADRRRDESVGSMYGRMSIES